MEFVSEVALTFFCVLAMTVGFGFLLHLGKNRVDWHTMLAIPVGMAISKAIQLQWPVDGLAHYLEVGAPIGLVMFVAQYLHARTVQITERAVQ